VQILTCRATLVDIAGGRQRTVSVDMQERLDRAIDRSDAVQVRLRGLDRADLLAVQAIRELGGAGAGDVGSHV